MVDTDTVTLHLPSMNLIPPFLLVLPLTQKNSPLPYFRPRSGNKKKRPPSIPPPVGRQGQTINMSPSKPPSLRTYPFRHSTVPPIPREKRAPPSPPPPSTSVGASATCLISSLPPRPFPLLPFSTFSFQLSTYRPSPLGTNDESFTSFINTRRTCVPSLEISAGGMGEGEATENGFDQRIDLPSSAITMP